MGFFAEDGDGALEAAGAQCLRRTAASLARSCDHEFSIGAVNFRFRSLTRS